MSSNFLMVAYLTLPPHHFVRSSLCFTNFASLFWRCLYSVLLFFDLPSCKQFSLKNYKLYQHASRFNTFRSVGVQTSCSWMFDVTPGNLMLKWATLIAIFLKVFICFEKMINCMNWNSNLCSSVVLKLWYGKALKLVREGPQVGTRIILFSVFLHVLIYIFYMSGSVDKFLNFCVAYFPCWFQKWSI